MLYSGILTLNSMTKTLDVPYGSSFQTEEKWEVSPIEGQPEKCLLRCSVWVRFWKSLFLKKTIETKVIEGVTVDNNLWLKNLREKKIIIEGVEKKQASNTVNSINRVEFNHEIEKSQDMFAEELKDKDKLGCKEDKKNETVNKDKQRFSLKNSQFYWDDFQKKAPSLNLLISFVLIMIILIMVANFIKFKSASENRMTNLEFKYHEQQELIYELNRILKSL